MPLSNDDANAVLLPAHQIQRAQFRGVDEVEMQRFIERAEASGYSPRRPGATPSGSWLWAVAR